MVVPLIDFSLDSNQFLLTISDESFGGEAKKNFLIH